MTLRRFMLLVDRFKERNKREDRRAGEVAAMAFNLKAKEPIDWTDVFPEWAEGQHGQTEEQMLQTMMAWTKLKPLPS